MVNILLHISEDQVTVPEQGAHAGHSHDQRHYHFYGADGSDRHINATAFLEKLHALPGSIYSSDDVDGQLQLTQVLQSGPVNTFMKADAPAPPGGYSIEQAWNKVSFCNIACSADSKTL